MERINRMKIAQLVAFRFPHFAAINHFKHHAPKVIGRMEPPVAKDHRRHRSVSSQTENPNSLKQFRTGDMMRLIRVRDLYGIAENILCRLECLR